MIPDALAETLEQSPPGALLTTSPDGQPHLAMVPFARRLDAHTVAVASIALGRTEENLRGRPRATLRILDLAQGQQVTLQLAYEEEETEGKLFDEMSARIKAMSELLRLPMAVRAAMIFKASDLETQRFSGE